MERFFASVGGMEDDGSGQSPSALKVPSRPISRNVPYKRIATEEAWGTAELFREWKKVLDAKPADEVGFLALWRNPVGTVASWPLAR